MITSGSLTPAYGRDYKSGKDAKAAFLAGKDFYYQAYNEPTRLCSIRDCTPGASIQIRFKKLSSVCVVKVPNKA